MNIHEIDKAIKSVQSQIVGDEKNNEILELMRTYDGDEEVISSVDYMQAMKILRGDRETLKLSSGFTQLDKITEGFWEGNIIVISGPTKEGKTTFCQSLTIHFTRDGNKCLWFPFDTPGEEVIQRFDEPITIYLPKKNPIEKKLDWIEKKIIEGIAKFGTRVVFVDHLAMLTKATDSDRNYSTELSSIMMELKQIAIRWRVVIFLNHHIRKIQADTVPLYSDLKDSSGVAQDSDMVIMIWRKKTKKDGIIQHMDKAIASVQTNRRTGRTGVVHLIHKGDHFEEESVIETVIRDDSITASSL